MLGRDCSVWRSNSAQSRRRHGTSRMQHHRNFANQHRASQDRKFFSALLDRLELKQAPAGTAVSAKEAVEIAKEIGYKNWLLFDTLDFDTYPGVGHPFADFWGMWVDTECESADGSGERVACCLTMGGCGDDASRPYPPPRQTPINKVRKDLDPSLAYDVSEFGHLGYNQDSGPPNPDEPVQDQYLGTWTLWTPPNDNPAVGLFLAEKVVDFVTSPRPDRAVEPVYLGNQAP